jgi:glyoxylase-like metal-dependent hydrolase (beta-lactamase superfamily II)
VQEIADRIFYIEGENKGRYPDCHSLFIDGDTPVIIDPASRETLMQRLASKPGVDIILNTHYHEDHRIYNYCFEGAELLVHKLDAHGYGSIDHFMNGFSVVNSPSLRELWHAFLLETCKYRPYTVDETFTDGFALDLGNTTVQVIHTPGHSAGHCCFYLPREGIAYLGDIDLTPFGPWYASTNSSIDDFLCSVERVREVSPSIVITSHGDGLIRENVDARLMDYAGIIHRRDEKILDFLTRPRSLEEILDLEVVYRRNQKTPDAFFYWDDRWMIEEHVNRLMRLGRITRQEEKYLLCNR